MKKLSSFFIFALTFTLNAKADNSSSVKIKTPEVKASDKADELITNRRFRASSGSLSKWSFATTWNYNAGSLSSPLDAERPNLNAQGDIAAIQSLNADLNVSYRITKVDRLNLGVGMQILAPFHSTIDTEDATAQKEFDDNQGDVDLNNPTLAYSRVAKFGGVQTILGLSLRQYTTGNLVDRGFDRRYQATVNTMYDVGATGFSFGAYLLYSEFDGDDAANLQASQLEREFAILPQAEYVINDTFNLRTISRAWWYQKTPVSDYKKLTFTQSVGLGISVTRDIFLYPNIQFLPGNISSNETNIGLNANINLF